MLLECTGLTKRYPRGREEITAVDGVDFSVERGEFVSIVGRSGSGKSTLLNMLAGMTRPTAGQVSLEGRALYEMTDKALSDLRNEGLGFIPQGLGTLANLTVLENVLLPFYLHKRHGDPLGRGSFLLEEVGLSALGSMYPGQLSGGELRRVLIARALMNEPDILIADEPTASLDVETSGEIMKLFQRVNQGGTALLIVTHELDTVDYAGRVLTMEAGRLTAGVGLGKGKGEL